MMLTLPYEAGSVGTSMGGGKTMVADNGENKKEEREIIGGVEGGWENSMWKKGGVGTTLFSFSEG